MAESNNHVPLKRGGSNEEDYDGAAKKPQWSEEHLKLIDELSKYAPKNRPVDTTLPISPLERSKLPISIDMEYLQAFCCFPDVLLVKHKIEFAHLSRFLENCSAEMRAYHILHLPKTIKTLREFLYGKYAPETRRVSENPIPQYIMAEYVHRALSKDEVELSLSYLMKHRRNPEYGNRCLKILSKMGKTRTPAGYNKSATLNGQSGNNHNHSTNECKFNGNDDVVKEPVTCKQNHFEQLSNGVTSMKPQVGRKLVRSSSMKIELDMDHNRVITYGIESAIRPASR